MDVPLELAFHNVDKSPVIEDRIREKVGKLDRLYDHLVSCRVTVEAPHHRLRKGHRYEVRIEMSVPGDHIVINRGANHAKQKFNNPDLYDILNDAFDAAHRRLKEYKERQRDNTPAPHDGPLFGTVSSLPDDEPYGFVTTRDGRELYFHRNAVQDNKWKDLALGDTVEFVENMGATGPQAARVWLPPQERQAH